jgi:hypothetical protein
MPALVGSWESNLLKRKIFPLRKTTEYTACLAKLQRR